MESFIEFRKRVSKATSHHKHKIRNSLGVYDGYKWYRKNKPDNKKYILSESQYFAIIRQMNNILSEELARGNEVILPLRMGILEIRKYEKSIKIGEDDKVITNLPVDWDNTLKLWYEDREAYENKTLLRIDEKEIYKIVWNKENVNFNNKAFYEFVFNRDLKQKLKHNIKEGTVNALHIGRRKRNVV